MSFFVSIFRLLSTKIAPWFFRFARARSLASGLFCLLGAALFAGQSVSPTPLTLSDGRVFESWTVLRQTDDTLTIRYQNGVAKVKKALLPPDVLALYPIVEPPPPKPAALPPEPPGLGKPNKGERSISARDAISGTEVVWTCRIAVQGKAGGITRRSKNRADEFKTDFVLPFGVDDVGALEQAIARARKWTSAVVEKKPTSFDKSMGPVLGHEWTFSWDSEHIVIHTGNSEAPSLLQQDLEKIQTLLAALPHMEKERLDETKAAEDFAATLK